MALFVNGSRIRSAHGYVRPFSGLRGLGGFGSLPPLVDTVENRTFQAVLNRYAAKVKFTPITVDGKIGLKETAPAARKVGTWIAENIAGVSFDSDYVQALRSLDTTRIAAEAERFANILDSIANREGLPTTTKAGTPSTPSSAYTPIRIPAPDVDASGGRIPAPDVDAPPVGAPATGTGRGLLIAGAVAALGLALVLGGGKKRKRR